MCDAYIGNFQEKMFKQYNATSNEMMIYPNLYSAVFSCIAALIGDEITPAIQFIQLNPTCIHAIMAYSLLNIIGIYFVLASLERFGATTTTFVTSLRKAVSVIISFLLFTNPFSMYYAIGGALTAAGIYLNVHAKQYNTKQPSSDKSIKHNVELNSIATSNTYNDTEPLVDKSSNTTNTNTTNGVYTIPSSTTVLKPVIDDNDIDIAAYMNSDNDTITQKINPVDIQSWLKQSDAAVNKRLKT